MEIEEGMMEWWNNGRLGKEEGRIQETEERGQSHRTSEARGQEDNGNTNHERKKTRSENFSLFRAFLIFVFS
jgi:hypothetical protein